MYIYIYYHVISGNRIFISWQALGAGADHRAGACQADVRQKCGPRDRGRFRRPRHRGAIAFRLGVLSEQEFKKALKDEV